MSKANTITIYPQEGKIFVQFPSGWQQYIYRDIDELLSRIDKYLHAFDKLYTYQRYKKRRVSIK